MTITNQIISFKLSGISYSGTSTQLNYTAGVSTGVCVASKALIVDSFRNISNINTLTVNTLTANTLNGTLSTGNQPNITALGTLTNLSISNNLTLNQHNGSTIGLILGSTLVTATGIQLNYNDITTSGVAQPSKTLVLNSNSNISGINILSATSLVSTNLTLNGTLLTISGNQLNYNNITTPGVAQASRTLVLNSSSNISGINTLSATTINATTLTGSLSGEQTGITAVGSLSSLVVNGDITGVNNVILSDTLTGDNIVGRILTGRIVTSDQPNITSLGSLSNLTVSGQITANTISATNISVGGTDITSTLSNLGSISGVTAGTAGASKALILDASRNITNINSLTSTSLVATGTITGQLATASQPAITSVGNLTTLAIAGSITTVTNIAMTGSLSGANSISATNFNGTITSTFANQPNITTLGTLTNLFVSGNISVGTTLPSRKLEINSDIGSCLRLSYGAATGNATNYTDLTLNSSGALTVNSSNDLINLQSRVVVGKSSTANILCFNGVTGDAGNNMTVIAERLYNISDFSELLLFKGNDLSGASGPDRIRMRSAEMRFQIISSVEEYTTLADNNDALIISSAGRIGINTDISKSSSSQQLEINNSTGNCLRLIFNSSSGSPTVYSDINVNSSGTLNIKSTNNNVQIGDSSDTAQILSVGSSLSTATTGIVRTITTTIANYIQSGINTTTGSASDLIISNYSQSITTSARKIVFKADGKVGFGTSAPTRQLEINEATGNCLRLSYNASAGSATTYCDQSVSSTGVVTFTAAGSSPGFAFSGGNITGTLATASQPNITSLGILTGLTLSGAISGVTNLSLSGTISGASSISATTLVGTLSTAAQGSITSVGSLTGLYVNGNVNVGSSSSGTDLLNISSTSAAFTGLRIENRNTTATSSGTKISFNGFSSTNTNYEVARIASITTDSGVSASYQFGSLAFYTRGNNISANAEERMRILSTGNVGIGFTSPSYLLDVNGTSRSKQLLVGTSTDTTSTRLISALDSTITNGSIEYITLGKSASLNNQAELGYSHTSDGSTSNALTLGLFGSEKMRIVANGKLGLGTTNPVALIDMGSTASDQSLFLWNNSTNIFGFGANNSLLKYQSGSNAGHAWYTNSTPTSTGTQIMSLDYTGNLALSGNISCTLSTSGFGGLKYGVTGIGNAVAQTYAGAGDAGIGTSSTHPFGFITSGVYRMYITSAGYVGVGTMSPLYPLHVATTSVNTITGTYAFVAPNITSGTVTATSSSISLYTAGRIYCGSELNVASDRRVKENIKIIEDDFCEKFIKLSKPVKYNYINQDDLQYGYIAQDLLGLHIGEGIVGIIENPDLIDTIDEESGIKNPKGIQFTIAYDKIVPILGNGLKIAYNKIDNLSSQIKEIDEQRNKEINSLKQQMAEMQKTLELLLQKN